MIRAFRADDRLIHGQVQTMWISEYGVNRVMIIDDSVASDPLQIHILKLAKPTGIDLVICGEDRAMELIGKDALQPNAKTFVIFKTIETALRMQELGLEIPKIVIGPCSAKPGATQIGKNTYFTQSEIDATNKLLQSGTEILLQLLPNDTRVLWGDIKL